MTDHIMKINQVPGTLGMAEGYMLCFVQQATDAAVANNDTLTFNNVSHVIPIGIASEIGSIIDFDASAVESTVNWRLTVNTTVITTGTAATRVEGLALVKF